MKDSLLAERIEERAAYYVAYFSLLTSRAKELDRYLNPEDLHEEFKPDVIPQLNREILELLLETCYPRKWTPLSPGARRRLAAAFIYVHGKKSLSFDDIESWPVADRKAGKVADFLYQEGLGELRTVQSALHRLTDLGSLDRVGGIDERLLNAGEKELKKLSQGRNTKGDVLLAVETGNFAGIARKMARNSLPSSLA